LKYTINKVIVPRVVIKLLKEINSDDELINTQSVIEENLKKIQEQRMLEAQSHINPQQQQKQGA
jgi:hypothetical protein